MTKTRTKVPLKFLNIFNTSLVKKHDTLIRIFIIYILYKSTAFLNNNQLSRPVFLLIWVFDVNNDKINDFNDVDFTSQFAEIQHKTFNITKIFSCKYRSICCKPLKALPEQMRINTSLTTQHCKPWIYFYLVYYSKEFNTNWARYRSRQYKATNTDVISLWLYTQYVVWCNYRYDL